MTGSVPPEVRYIPCLLRHSIADREIYFGRMISVVKTCSAQEIFIIPPFFSTVLRISVQRLILLAGEVIAAEHQRITVRILRAAVGCPDQTVMLRFSEFQIDEPVFRLCSSFNGIVEQIGKDGANIQRLPFQSAVYHAVHTECNPVFGHFRRLCRDQCIDHLITADNFRGNGIDFCAHGIHILLRLFRFAFPQQHGNNRQIILHIVPERTGILLCCFILPRCLELRFEKMLLIRISFLIGYADAVLAARFVSEDYEAVILDDGKQNADCNRDGSLTADDLTIILKAIAKLIEFD